MDCAGSGKLSGHRVAVALRLGDERRFQIGPEATVGFAIEGAARRNTHAEITLGAKYRFLGRLEAEMRAGGHRTGRLCCFTENLRAMRFYQGRGWTAAGEGVNEETGAPETRMEKCLMEEGGRDRRAPRRP